MCEDFHQRNKAVGNLDQPCQHYKEPQKQQQSLKNVQDNSHDLCLLEVGGESSVELDFGSIGHLIKRGNEVVVKGQELWVAGVESGVVHVPEGDDLFD